MLALQLTRFSGESQSSTSDHSILPEFLVMALGDSKLRHIGLPAILIELTFA